VSATARPIERNSQGSNIHEGDFMRKRLRRVPPDIEETAAMRVMPPKSIPLAAATLAPTAAKAKVASRSQIVTSDAQVMMM